MKIIQMKRYCFPKSANVNSGYSDSATLISSYQVHFLSTGPEQDESQESFEKQNTCWNLVSKTAFTLFMNISNKL